MVGCKHNVRNDQGYSPTDEAESRRRSGNVEMLRTFTVKSSEHMERIRFFQDMYKDRLNMESFDKYMNSEKEKRDLKRIQISFGNENDTNQSYNSEESNEDDDDNGDDGES